MTKQFCKAKKGQIYDQFNQPLLLRGVGIGGWLLLEGYMIKSYEDLDRPRRIKDYIANYISQSYANYFFEEWGQRFFGKKDIIRIKEDGFNCIRIPLDYEFLYIPSDHQAWLEPRVEHLQLLDRIINYCAEYKLYVILDLHAAPGGQTGTNIDNSLDDQPRLFTEEIFQTQTINIWQDLANRYKSEQYVLAYDLLNEPLPNWFDKYNHKLLPLYKRIIHAIRSVDPHHMISLEGLHWSTDLSIFTSLSEKNILLQFHKYWSNPDIESIEEYLFLRKKLQLPLIMGEGGENNNLWYSTVFKLYHQTNISYAFWTYKKMNASNAIMQFKEPRKWTDFLNHTLSKEDAKDTLNQLLEYITFEETCHNNLVVNHLMQKDSFSIPAYGFDFYGEGISKSSKTVRKTSFRQNDSMAILNEEGQVITPNFKQYNGENMPKKDQLYLFLTSGEWVTYTFSLTSHGPVAITITGNQIKDQAWYLDDQLYQDHEDSLLVDCSKGIHKLTIKAIADTRVDIIEINKSKAVKKL